MSACAYCGKEPAPHTLKFEVALGCGIPGTFTKVFSVCEACSEEKMAELKRAVEADDDPDFKYVMTTRLVDQEHEQ